MHHSQAMHLLVSRGFTLAQADGCRKAIQKRLTERARAYHQQFTREHGGTEGEWEAIEEALLGPQNPPQMVEQVSAGASVAAASANAFLYQCAFKEVQRLRKALVQQNYVIEQALGGALYGFSEEGLPLWGEHTAETLAEEAAQTIQRLRKAIREASACFQAGLDGYYDDQLVAQAMNETESQL